MEYRLSVLFIASILAVSACTDFQEEQGIPSGLIVDTETIMFPADASTQTILVRSGSKWRINNIPDWIQVQSFNNQSAFRYEWSVTFSAQSNSGYDRKGTISIGTEDETITIPVEQKGKKGAYVAVESVSINKAEMTLTKGDFQTLTASVKPSNASEKSVRWSSNNTAVATVSSDGLVTAIEVGTATITVTTDDGNKTATCTVTVTPVTVNGVSLNKTTLSLIVGDSETLTATIFPSNAANKNVTWSSSNTSVATVDSNGKVTGIAPGSATITATTQDGGKTATCTVTVNPIAVTGISLNQSSITLTVGDIQTLTATISPSNATDKSLTWTSSNTSVASVSSNGVVTAKAAGSATITATTNDGGKKASCSVTVQEKTIAVTGVSLDKTSISMIVGDTQLLTATITPANATDKSVFWSSSNTSVVTVSNSGLLTAKATGSATITVTTNDGGKKATCAVTVQAQTVVVTGVSLDKTSLSMTVGDTQTLTATVTPSNATDKSVSWSSSNTSVATVSSSGVVTAKSAGTTTITTTTNDGGKKATCTVTVKAATVSVTGINLNKTSMTLLIGGTESLTATVTPSNATNKNVIWSSSNSSVVLVDSNGNVSAINVGTAIITVTTEDGGKTATCSVTVNPIFVTGVTLNQTNLIMAEGDTQILTATVTPSNATDKSVSWSSSNTSVATVSSSGVVTAKSAGTATITATTNDGGKKATCTVTVKAATVSVTGVNLNKTSMSLLIGGTERLTATVTPSNATNKNLTWSSSNTSIATVDSNGNVSAIKVGTADITVKTEDGGKTATCAVTVNPISVTGVSLNQTSLTMTEGDTQTLTATITPSNATDKSVTWSSSNTSVATVSSSGVVTAKAAGSATITVTTTDGGKKATCSVTVQAQTISVTGVSLNKTSLSMTVGNTQTLTATVTPSNATDMSVTWSSSNTSVATVSSSGIVTAKSAGSATITVKTNDGNKTATCAVTVKSRDLNGSGNEGSNEEEMF